jgi:hypothetical protein
MENCRFPEDLKKVSLWNAQGIAVEILFCLPPAGKKDWNG